MSGPNQEPYIASPASSLPFEMHESSHLSSNALQPAFTKFPELPTELRLKIWQHTSEACRTIELMYCIVDRRFMTFQPPPAVLSTCRESREVGLNNYHLSFGTDTYPPSTYFNSVQDTIYFGSRQYDDEIEYMVKHFRKHSESLENRDQIRHLAMAEYLWRREYDGSPLQSSRSFLEIHESFPLLEELVFVKKPDEGDDLTEEVEASWENYAGISLIKSPIKPSSLPARRDLLVDSVVSAFESHRVRYPKSTFPEITIMEYGFS